MKILLVGPEIEENLGLRYLAASLEAAGHDCRIVPFNRGHEVERAAHAVLRQRPQLVGLALVAQHRFADVRALAGELRRRGYRGHVTAGGHFASLRAGEILRDTPALDTILHHDAEERIVALARWVEAGSVGAPPPELDGVTWRDGPVLRHRPPVRVPPLETLRPPRRGRPGRLLGYPVAPLVSSRGCSGSCSFCSIHAWHGQVPSGRLRLRAPDAVAAEMDALHRERGVRVFVFHDDDFLHPDERRALARCQAILGAAQARIGEPFAFVIKVRPDHVSEPLFNYLKSAGLARAYVGIETHSRAGMRALNRHATPETNERALATLRALDVHACFNLLVLQPDSTVSEIEENLAFLDRQLDVPFDVARAELYARSTLEDRVVRQGRAVGDYRGFDYEVQDPVAEAWFRLFARALWERHFGEQPILQRVQNLRLQLGVLERLHPGVASAELRARVVGLIRETNRDTVEWLRVCLERARDLDGCVAPEVREHFAAEVEPEVRARVRSQHARCGALELELYARAWLGRATGHLPMPSPRLAARVANAASGLALLAAAAALPGCPGTTYADPPPPPCMTTLALNDGGVVAAGSFLALPFRTSQFARLNVTVDWTTASSPMRLFLVPGTCSSQEIAEAKCLGTTLILPSGRPPLRFTIEGVEPGSHQLVFWNDGAQPQSVTAQVVESDTGYCVPHSAAGSGGPR